MDPLAVMQAYGAAWERGDPPAAWAFYADDVVMHLPGRGRLAGAHRGRTAVIAAIQQLLEQTSSGDVEVEVVDRLVSDDRVAMLVREAVQRGDERLELRRVNVYRVRGGKIASIEIFEANQYEVDEFFG
jgi:hypothetical protein